jgi:dienelactone hydrolase
MLAGLGYAAFVADLYGDGLFVGYTAEAETRANQMIADPALLVRRVEAGLQAMTGLSFIDSNRVAAVGYCLGGMGVLNLVRSGARLRAAIAFHGLLTPRGPDMAGPVSTPILLCTGTEDPFVPLTDVGAFCDEMTAAAADYRIILYGGAGHAFTSFEISPGMIPVASGKFGFHEAADRDAWTQMSRMLADLL